MYTFLFNFKTPHLIHVTGIETKYLCMLVVPDCPFLLIFTPLFCIICGYNFYLAPTCFFSLWKFCMVMGHSVFSSSRVCKYLTGCARIRLASAVLQIVDCLWVYTSGWRSWYWAYLTLSSHPQECEGRQGTRSELAVWRRTRQLTSTSTRNPGQDFKFKRRTSYVKSIVGISNTNQHMKQC